MKSHGAQCEKEGCAGKLKFIRGAEHAYGDINVYRCYACKSEYERQELSIRNRQQYDNFSGYRDRF